MKGSKFHSASAVPIEYSEIMILMASVACGIRLLACGPPSLGTSCRAGAEPPKEHKMYISGASQRHGCRVLVSCSLVSACRYVSTLSINSGSRNLSITRYCKYRNSRRTFMKNCIIRAKEVGNCESNYYVPSRLAVFTVVQDCIGIYRRYIPSILSLETALYTNSIRSRALRRIG